MADYSERATQLPEARPVSNVTPANAALVESAGQAVNLFTEAEKTGKKESYAEQTRNNYFDFLGRAPEEVANIAKAERLQAESFSGKPLAPADEAFLKAHQQDSDKRKAAYEQGYTRLNDFRLAEESRLRAAIRARPDLGDELRAISQKELGVDVYTSRMKMFSDELDKAQQAAESMKAAADRRTKDAMSLIKFHVDVGGVGAQVYRNVDPLAPVGAPNSIEAANATYATMQENDPELKTEAALGAIKTGTSVEYGKFNSYIKEKNLTDPAVMQQVLADPASMRAVTTQIDTHIATIQQQIAAAETLSTGSYKADGDAIVNLAKQQLEQMQKLRSNFTAEGVGEFVEYQKNSEVVQLSNANPAIVNIAGDIIPKGAPDTDRTKAIITANKLYSRVGDNSWSSASEYLTTVSNSVPQVGNILLSPSAMNKNLLAQRAPTLAAHITLVGVGLATPYKRPDGTIIAPPMESIINRQGTGFLNLITQSGDTAVRIYEELNPAQKTQYANGIIRVTNMYVQQKYQQAKQEVPQDVAKYIGTYKIVNNKSLDRSGGEFLGWVPNTPEEIKTKYQGVLDKVQYSETGPNGLSLVRNTIKMMTNPSESTWFGVGVGK